MAPATTTSGSRLSIFSESVLSSCHGKPKCAHEQERRHCKCDLVKSVGAAPKRQQFGNKVDLTTTQFAEPRLVALMTFDSIKWRSQAISPVCSASSPACICQIVLSCVTYHQHPCCDGCTSVIVEVSLGPGSPVRQHG
jgi:hypothetical protein